MSRKISITLYDWCVAHNKMNLINEWDELQNNKTPKDVSYACNVKFYWKCLKCGNVWLSSCSNRTISNRGCPKCAKERIAKRLSTVKSIDESILIKYPRIASEWNYELNKEGPEKYYPSSNKKVWWHCKTCNQNWQAVISHRCNRNSNCPICSNKKVVKGVNDLFTTNPELKEEWDFDKNTVDPSTLSFGSKVSVHWKCKKGHEWSAKVYQRTTQESGCPKCNAERKTSLPEKVVYYYISKFFPDAQENYHAPFLQRKELDIFIPSINVGIEYDGVAWHHNIDKDLLKDRICADNGIQVIRIREGQCPDYNSSAHIIYTDNYDKDCNYLEEPIKKLLSFLGVSFNDLTIKKDLPEIMTYYYTKEKENSLAQDKRLMAEWDFEKNKGINPEYISKFSNRKFYWKCPKCGYEWYVSANKRSIGHKCPVCTNQAVKEGYNDLQTINPILASEWDYDKNETTPNKITARTNKKYYWKCKKCSHVWQATVSSRMLGCGCPECKKITISEKQTYAPYEKSFGFLYPELLKEWDYSKNKLSPFEVYPKSNKHFYWKCSTCGYEWSAVLSSRTKEKNPTGCINCYYSRIRKNNKMDNSK